jgi:hypothetical protein
MLVVKLLREQAQSIVKTKRKANGSNNSAVEEFEE